MSRKARGGTLGDGLYRVSEKRSDLLLTLVDRYSRECMIFKLGRQSQDAVVRRLNGLERRMGSKAFKARFKSIMVDHGSEFLDWKRMEKSIKGDQLRTQVYYARAYASWERGSSEI